MDNFYLREIVFIVAGIGGALVLMWIGVRQRRFGRGTEGDFRRERAARRGVLRGPPAGGAATPSLEALRRFASREEDSAGASRRAAADAARDGDADVAAFLEERATESEDAATRALDILRSRLRDPPHAPSP